MKPFTTEAAVAARELTKLYGTGAAAVRALDDVSVSFEAGAFSAIMGPSGSGKSTLMHCLAGLETPTSGHVFVGSLDLAGQPDRVLTAVRRDRIGFVFQAFNLLPSMSAQDNIVLPLRLAGRKADQAWFSTLTEFLGLRERLAHRPAELSGGQQQRVALARALVTRPDVVFADEPTGSLDSTAGTEVLTLLRHCVREFGQTVVMVTHDERAAGHADRVVHMADGKVSE
ncbi:ABC transporter ATP-binding protein [Amycolatopsis carbonis]|uniref:ABC transporter ATP-binding protein n=1 Tax=Amycolatopsis carbonis TaxID=715471 RepID=A0A9Y2MV77_9PSEU|nr:ABC transporter ATP-binding protein [Amycolatopsis sp. 2-15]WIX82600.1 ABC transporter ATP-binding protein [Amycolatopsis sp. 2-15]